MTRYFLLCCILFTTAAIHSQGDSEEKQAELWRVVRLAQNHMHPLRTTGWVGTQEWWFVSSLEEGIATASRWVTKPRSDDEFSSYLGLEGRLLDASGKMLDEPVFEDIGPFQEGLSAVKMEGQWGFIDRDLRQVIPFSYDGVLAFLHGWCAVSKDGKWGFIDRRGEWVIQPQWEEVRAFPHPDSNSLARVRIGEVWGFINRKGKLVIPAQYDYAYAFIASSTLVRDAAMQGEPDYWKLIDETGATISTERWKFAFGFPYNDLPASVQAQDGRWGFLNPDGTYLFEPQWDSTLDFRDGYAVVRRNGKSGMIDLEGRQIIDYEWDNLMETAGGFVITKRGALHGYIEIATGREIPPQWEHAEPFENGRGLVRHEGEWILINPDGTPAAPSFPRWPVNL